MYFSLIVPIYNVEEYLEECLRSIINQSYSDFEVIAINDGSTDGSKEILERFSKVDDRIHAINQHNQGLSNSRNRGVDIAQGKYIIFIDADDMLCTHALSTLHSHCQEYNLDLLMFSAKSFGINIPENTKGMYKRNTSLTNQIFTSENNFIDSVSINNYYSSVCLYATKLSISKKFKFFPDIYHEDNLYTTELLINSNIKRLKVITDELYLRRIRPNSITQSEFSKKHIDGYLTVFIELTKIKKNICPKKTTLKNSIDKNISTLFYTALNKTLSHHNKKSSLREKLKFIVASFYHPKLLTQKKFYRILFFSYLQLHKK